MTVQNIRRWLVVAVALLGAFWIVRLIAQPTYTDAFYHYNAAARWAQGDGLTEPYVWTYIGQQAPAAVVPSHLYWMPGTSFIVGAAMAFFQTTDYAIAQLPLVLMFAGVILISYGLGWRIGGTARHAWAAALLTLFSGFFAKLWGETDTFTPYALVGALCLWALGMAITEPRRRWFLLAGLMAGAGHLVRSDGLLLLIVGVLLIPTLGRGSWQRRLIGLALFVAAYVLVMGGWFVHLHQITGHLLPVGGLQAVWFSEYNDLFRYPPDADATTFLADGLGRFLETRWLALTQNLQTFFFVEGWVVLMPFILIGAWQRRGRFLAPTLLFALGLHVAMTFVFAFPGWRGGLLHGAVALLPAWAVLAVVGVDAVVDWVAKRRRNWKAATAKRVFTGGIVALALVLTLTTIQHVAPTQTPALYPTLQRLLPADARVLINDPAQLYYYTGLGGAVLPNNLPATLAQLAQDYAITHLVLEQIVTDDGVAVGGALPAPLMPILEALPAFLEEIPTELADVRVYAFR